MVLFLVIVPVKATRFFSPPDIGNLVCLIVQIIVHAGSVAETESTTEGGL